MSNQDLPAEVPTHDIKSCALCRSPVFLENGEPNRPVIHHSLEALVANGLLRKLRKEDGSIAYIERHPS